MWKELRPWSSGTKPLVSPLSLYLYVHVSLCICISMSMYLYVSVSLSSFGCTGNRPVEQVYSMPSPMPEYVDCNGLVMCFRAFIWCNRRPACGRSCRVRSRCSWTHVPCLSYRYWPLFVLLCVCSMPQAAGLWEELQRVKQVYSMPTSMSDCVHGNGLNMCFHASIWCHRQLACGWSCRARSRCSWSQDPCLQSPVRAFIVLLCVWCHLVS